MAMDVEQDVDARLWRLGLLHSLHGLVCLVGVGVVVVLNLDAFPILSSADVDRLAAPSQSSQAVADFPERYSRFLGTVLPMLGVVALAASVNFIAARALRRRRGRMLLVLLSVVNLLVIPLGTVLGVWTLWTLNRREVREQVPF